MANDALPLRTPGTLTIGRDNLLSLTEAVLEPAILVLSLWGVANYYEGELPPAYLVLSLIVFSVTFPGPSRLRLSILGASWHILLSWVMIAFLLTFLGWATHFLQHFQADVIYTWFVAAPALSILTHLVFRFSAPFLLQLQTAPKRAVVVDQGVELWRRIAEDRYSNTEQ
jgi:putative colanic acid biosynthesis UDP-glucose lipid carrier transferase